MTLSIKPEGDYRSGVCPCCGSVSRVVSGAVQQEGVTVATFEVHWTADQVTRHGANVDLAIVCMGDDATLEHRSFVSLAYRLFATGPSFMVIDANERAYAQGQAGHIRDDVIGTDMARAAFALVDAIWLGDARIAALVQQVH